MTDEPIDLARECFCSCHIGPTKFAFGISKNEIHVEDVTRRIRCTNESYLMDPSGKLCCTCGRVGKDRYGEISDLAGTNFELLHKYGGSPVDHRPPSKKTRPLDPIAGMIIGDPKARKGFVTLGQSIGDLKELATKMKAAQKQDEELRAAARANLGEVEGCLDVVRDLLQLFLEDGHVGADFDNWVKLARYFGREQEARELADSYDPEGKWLEKVIA